MRVLLVFQDRLITTRIPAGCPTFIGLDAEMRLDGGHLDALRTLRARRTDASRYPCSISRCDGTDLVRGAATVPERAGEAESGRLRCSRKPVGSGAITLSPSMRGCGVRVCDVESSPCSLLILKNSKLQKTSKSIPAYPHNSKFLYYLKHLCRAGTLCPIPALRVRIPATPALPR